MTPYSVAPDWSTKTIHPSHDPTIAVDIVLFMFFISIYQDDNMTHDMTRVPCGST
jgi:hypothetical protein